MFSTAFFRGFNSPRLHCFAVSWRVTWWHALTPRNPFISGTWRAFRRDASASWCDTPRLPETAATVGWQAAIVSAGRFWQSWWSIQVYWHPRHDAEDSVFQRAGRVFRGLAVSVASIDVNPWIPSVGRACFEARCTPRQTLQKRGDAHVPRAPGESTPRHPGHRLTLRIDRRCGSHVAPQSNAAAALREHTSPHPRADAQSGCANPVQNLSTTPERRTCALSAHPCELHSKYNL